MSKVSWEPSGLPRTLSVKGSAGVSATVVVTVRQGEVWMSIMPPFTWEAIMEPRKVGELIETLTHAAEDAQRMIDKRCASGGSQPVERAARALLSGKSRPQ